MLVKKYSPIFIIILIVIAAIIIVFKINGKKSVDLQFIIVTESKMTVDEVQAIINDSLKKSDSKIKAHVRESSDEVVKLENTFVGTINTKLNEDEILKILSKNKEFKQLQPNYEFKIKE